jgi:hypothetical protein
MDYSKQYQNQFLQLNIATNSGEFFHLIDSILDFDENAELKERIVIDFEFYLKEQEELVTLFHHEYDDNNLYRTYFGDELATSDTNFTTQKVRGTLYRYEDRFKEQILETVFMRPLRAILAHHGLFYLHCGLIVKDNNCVIVVGPSGSGKTTLSVSLAQRGMTLATDDNCFIRREDNGITFYPFCTKLGAHETLLNRFPELRNLITDDFRYGNKQRISLRSPNSTETPRAYKCNAIIFPKFEVGSSFSFEQIGSQQTLKQLAEQSLQRYPEGKLKNELVPGNFWLISSLAKNTSAYKVDYGEKDLEAILDRVEKLITQP